MEDSAIKKGTFTIILEWLPEDWPNEESKKFSISKMALCNEVFAGFIGPGDFLCGMLGSMFSQIIKTLREGVDINEQAG